MRQSFGNSVMLEPYKHGQGVKTEIRGGFAFASQKKTLVPLKVMVNAWHPNGTMILAGSIAYLKEDKVTVEGWAKDVRKVEGTDLEVIIVDYNEISFFDVKDA